MDAAKLNSYAVVGAQPTAASVAKRNTYAVIGAEPAKVSSSKATVYAVVIQGVATARPQIFVST